MSETALVNACLIWLRCHGVMAWRNNTGAMTIRARGQRTRFVRFGIVGASDIFGVYQGRFVAVECKMSGRLPTVAQAAFLQEVNAHGGWGVIVYGVGQLDYFFQSAFSHG